MHDEDFESAPESDSQREVTDTDTDAASGTGGTSDAERDQERLEEMLEEEHDKILRGYYDGVGYQHNGNIGTLTGGAKIRTMIGVHHLQRQPIAT
jgi:hypothetical protein